MIRVDRGQCDVVTADGTLRADTAFVTPNDPLRVVCTGDWVAVEPAGNPRYVRTYLPRRTAFVRSTSSKRSEGQILAANVDHTIIAVPLNGELDLGRIERFLALAWESVIIVGELREHGPGPTTSGWRPGHAPYVRGVCGVLSEVQGASSVNSCTEKGGSGDRGPHGSGRVRTKAAHVT